MSNDDVGIPVAEHAAVVAWQVRDCVQTLQLLKGTCDTCPVLSTSERRTPAACWPVIQDLRVTAKKGDRVLLNGVSGLVCGGLCAVMVRVGHGHMCIIDQHVSLTQD